MNIRELDRLQETLYSRQMPNGLMVHVLPKRGFRKTYATFTTKYGSIDNHFRVEGKGEVKVPDGIAHFLEHKMFEEPEGGDVFARFSANGASANAFTSFDRTAYLFSATERIPENLTTLLDYVQNPYFTDDNVEKEKGIIGQEISMYQDHPDWRVYYGLIEALYQKHPVRIDIAGTAESIGRITKEMLYECYETFYHPSNMQLFVVGGVDPEEVFRLVESNQSAKTFGPSPIIQRLLPKEPDEVHLSLNRIQLSVAMPKCLFGFKETSHPDNPGALLRRELETRLLLDLLLGPSSDLYQTLYEEQLITDSFGSDFMSLEGASFSVIGGDAKDPQALLARFRELVQERFERGFKRDDFERCRKKRIGNYLKLLNSPEGIAHEFSKYDFKGMDFFSVLSVLESITLERVEQRMKEHFNWDRFSACVVEKKTD